MKDVSRTGHDLPGLEADNLLAFLAGLGLLRALECAEPGTTPRLSWSDRPWMARLHLDQPHTQVEVAHKAAAGISAIAQQYDVKDRRNVGEFSREDYRLYLLESRDNAVTSRLATAIAVEFPPKRDGELTTAPFVFQHGQGHQHFLSRLLDTTRTPTPPVRRSARSRVAPADGESYIRAALFAPWKRADETDAFRWDPEEDQRYAFRHGDPSKAGAAPTVHGANRLAGVGLLSFPCFPREAERLPFTGGVTRDADGLSFVWPLWSAPLTRHGIERLLSHPDVLAGRREQIRAFGVLEVLRARRVQNAKFMNVTRAVPYGPTAS